MSLPATKHVHTVSVRDLVAFVLRRGDLGGEREFVGSNRALAGIRGHQKIQRSRPSGYLTELPLEYVVEAAEFTLKIRGRIDGLLIKDNQVLLEEIKTVQTTWDHVADPLHWAQAKCYGFIHAQEAALKELVIQLVYLELPAGKITEFRETFTCMELADFFAATTAVYVDWLRERHAWCLARDASIQSLNFPFPNYRPGQRELAVSAYRVLANGGRLECQLRKGPQWEKVRFYNVFPENTIFQLRTWLQLIIPYESTLHWRNAILIRIPSSQPNCSKDATLQGKSALAESITTSSPISPD